jgi:hypothetical protein
MKQTLFIVILLIISQLTFAQSKDELAVSNAVETLKKAMIDADKATLETISAEVLSYGHSNGKIEDKKQFVEAIASGESDFVTIDLSNQAIKISKDIAIVRHRLDAKTNNKGVAGTTKLDVLLIFQKQKGKWLLVARQAVKVV